MLTGLENEQAAFDLGWMLLVLFLNYPLENSIEWQKKCILWRPNFSQPLDNYLISLCNNVCTHSKSGMEERQMQKPISCAFNMDSGCVELKFCDGSLIAINKCHNDLISYLKELV